MKALKFAVMLPGLLLVSGVLWAATQYGEAVIDKGSMTILREGRTLSFDQSNRGVAVNEGDLIRVRADSAVELKSRENATISLGSNAVFQVKPWRAQGKSGFLRALFGRFRASVASLSGGEQFNVRTATATIGVKGTKYFGQATNRGGALVAVTQSKVGVKGQSGGEEDVGEGFVSLVLGINPATPPIPIPQGMLDQMSGSLNSPAANSPLANRLVAQQLLIDAGLMTEDDLDRESGDDSGDDGDGGDDGGSGDTYTPEDETDTTAAGGAGRAFAPLNFNPTP